MSASKLEAPSTVPPSGPCTVIPEPIVKVAAVAAEPPPRAASTFALVVPPKITSPVPLKLCVPLKSIRVEFPSLARINFPLLSTSPLRAVKSPALCTVTSQARVTPSKVPLLNAGNDKVAPAVPLIVKLAQRRMPLEQVLHLKPGSMMHFQKPIDAPAELLVNNKSIASGQVIQSNERYGIRLTHVGDPRERVRSLQPLTSTRHA